MVVPNSPVAAASGRCHVFPAGAPKGLDGAAEGCPAFAHGCAFKDAKTAAELEEMLQQIPDSHKIGGQTFGSSEALRRVLEAIHVNAVAKARAGLEAAASECPVLAASAGAGGCPFKKALTSRGVPLVAELEYRTWAIVEATGDDDDGDGNVDDNAEDDDVANANANGKPGGKKSSTADAEADAALLATELKEGTKKSHRAAENVAFVRNFVKGRIDRGLYEKMLASLWHTYAALEDELRRNCDDPVYAELHFPDALERQAAIEEDLDHFLGPRWREDPLVAGGPSPATRDYVDRIRAVGRDAPELLVAHAYTRYLGDLSGGQVLGRVAKKALGLPEDGAGTAFYRFPQIPSAKVFKEEYRRLLDATGVSKTTADLIVAEANLAFVMNMRVFEELDVAGGDADRVRSLPEVLATLDMPVRENDKCPFAALGGPNPHAPSAASGGATAATTAAATAAVGVCPIPHETIRAVASWALHPAAWLVVAAVAAFFAMGRGLN